MSDQYDLYGGLPPHEPREGGSTSLAAATRILPDVNRLQAIVLAYIVSCGSYGATDQEIETATGLDPSTVRPRRRELQLGGRIRWNGQHRLTRAGRRATVWVAVS